MLDPEKQFQPQAARLIQFFGKNTFPAERVTALYEVVKELTEAELRQLVSAVIEEESRVPPISRFRELARPFLEQSAWRKKKELDRQAESRGACYWCASSGIIMAKHRTMSGADTAFRCPFCEAAQLKGMGNAIMLWTNDHLETYQLLQGHRTPTDDVPTSKRQPAQANLFAQPERVREAIAKTTKEMP